MIEFDDSLICVRLGWIKIIEELIQALIFPIPINFIDKLINI